MGSSNGTVVGKSRGQGIILPKTRRIGTHTYILQHTQTPRRRTSSHKTPFGLLLSWHSPPSSTVSQLSALASSSYVGTDLRSLRRKLQRKIVALQAKAISQLGDQAHRTNGATMPKYMLNQGSCPANGCSLTNSH